MGRRATGNVKVLADGRAIARLAGEYLGIHPSEELAWKYIRAAIKLDSGKAPDTVRVYGLRVLGERDKSGAVRSVKDEFSLWRTHIETAFFIDWQLRAVKPRHIEKWMKQLARKDALSPRRSGSGANRRTEYRSLGRKIGSGVIAHARRVLMTVFAQARIDGKVSSNPVDGVPVPKLRENVIEDEDVWTYLTLEEIDALFATLPRVDGETAARVRASKLRAFFAVAIYAGLRDGEVLGLRWADLVLDGQQPAFKVRKNRTGPVKTRASRREVPMLEAARRSLLVLRVELAAMRKAKGDVAARPFDLVFPSDHGGCYSRGYDFHWADQKERRVVRVPGPVRLVERSGDVYVNEGWRARAGVREYVTLHDLRHTCASHLVMGSWTPAPLNLMQVKAWLGHSSLATTQRYAHVAPGNLHDAVVGEDSWKVSGNEFPAPRMDRVGKRR